MADIESPMKYGKKLLHYDNRELNENEYRIANIELSPNEFVDHNNYMEFGPFGADVKEYEFLSIEQITQGKTTYKSVNWCESNDKVTEKNIYSSDPLDYYIDIDESDQWIDVIEYDGDPFYEIYTI